MSNWYSKSKKEAGTAREVKIERLEKLLNMLRDAIKGAPIDKYRTREILIEVGNGVDIKRNLELTEVLQNAINTVVDSPSNAQQETSIVFDLLADKLLELLEKEKWKKKKEEEKDE